MGEGNLKYGLERGNVLIPDYEPAFSSLSNEEASVLEKKVKEEYTISDYIDSQNPEGYKGWVVKDLQNGQEIIYSPNSRYITTKEYLRKDELNKPLEDVLDLVARVAVNIATAEKKYDVNADILGIAKKFAYRILHREFAPNTPTFANAGGHLQQLAACFGMTIEDYLGTDDIGEDPEKQGNGIFDILRYGAMIQKSGGGTGYNFSYTRPKNSAIATTGGRASGPESWLMVFNSGTEEINQGGFRRGANMGVLEYWHPDIFEFLSTKINHKVSFFNLSMGVDEEFMNKVENGGYFNLISPRDMNKIPLEQRIWTAARLVRISDFERLDETRKGDLDPSLLLSDDGKKVLVRYTGKEVGFIDEQGRININAKSTLEYASEMAHRTGCPGIIFFDTMNKDNPTPHKGKIRTVNPCGEQPLLDFEACNLGSTNLYSCVEDVSQNEFGTEFGLSRDERYFYGKIIGEKIQRRFDLKKFGGVIDDSVHFLDNVIDMGKYPFKKIYSTVKANRKIGLGLMGAAETSMALGINYESEDMENFAKFISSFMYKKAFQKSSELAEKKGSFPNWEGSIYDEESSYAKKEKAGKLRNATLLTIAPNGTTGNFAGVTGGIEPMFGIYFTKKLANGTELQYRNALFEEELKLRGLDTKEIIERIKKNGTVQQIKELPEDIRNRYKLAMEVDPMWHVRIQSAFQNGENGFGVDNAVSKTVNLPENSTPKDFFNIFMEARKRGCKGITGYRQGTISGQPLTIPKSETSEKNLEQIVRLHVPIMSPAITMADNSSKYRIERTPDDVFHVIFTDELMKDTKTEKIYLVPREVFQQSAPPGDEISVEFSASGIDRTNILKGQDPDYVKLIERWKSVTGNRSYGLGPKRINSPSHAVGLVFEHALLSRGLIEYDDSTGKIVQAIRKKDLVPLTHEEKTSIINSGREIKEQNIANKIVSGFLCEECGSRKYIFEQSCHEPKCGICGWTKTGNCS